MSGQAETDGRDIPEECFKDPCLQVDVVDVVEVGKVRVNLQSPVWLGQGYSSNKDEACFASNEGFNLDPRDDIVEVPRCYEENGCHGKVPTVNWSLDEDESSMERAEDKLEGKFSVLTGQY